MPPVPENSENKDYDYITRIIQYLDYKHNVSFFITTLDFDALYNWWHKRIPMRLLHEAIDTVVARRKKRNLPVKGFANFTNDVRKNFKAFMELNVGAHVTVSDGDNPDVRKNPDTEDNTLANQFAELDRFIENFPEPLTPLKTEFQQVVETVKNGRPIQTEELYDRLTALFTNDPELNLKVELFMKNLAKELRKPEIEQRYRLNFLLNRYRVPDFEMF